MKEYKGILLCSGGYSSSILSAKLSELGLTDNIHFDEGGLGSDNFENLCAKYDIILLAPHLSAYYDDYEDICEVNKTPFLQVESNEYVATNAQVLYDRVKQALEIK